MPLSNSKKIALQHRNQDIIEQALAGKSTHDIAEEYGLSDKRVQTILNEAMTEASIDLHEHALGLLAKNVARTEILLNVLMDETLNGDAVVFTGIDRIVKLMETQARLIGSVQTMATPDDHRKKYDPDAVAMTPDEYEEFFEKMSEDENWILIDEPNNNESPDTD